MIAPRVVTVGPSRALDPLLLVSFLSLLVIAACSDDRLASGAPCTTPFQCQTGLCLEQMLGVRVCARRCAASPECGAAEVCGRFDFRGRDDAGALSGDDMDIARVCRAPLAQRCDAGCGCTQPCDDVRDCPRYYGCDLTVVDDTGHGACVPITDADGGAASTADAADCGPG